VQVRHDCSESLVADVEFQASRMTELLAALDEEDTDRRWLQVAALGAQVEARMRPLEPADRRGAAYCFIAHLVNEVLRQDRAAPGGDDRRASRARGILGQFATRYGSGVE